MQLELHVAELERSRRRQRLHLTEGQWRGAPHELGVLPAQIQPGGAGLATEPLGAGLAEGQRQAGKSQPTEQMV